MVSYIEKEKYTAPVLQRKSKSYHNFLNRLHNKTPKKQYIAFSGINLLESNINN